MAEGDLTKAQADQMLTRLEQGIRDIVNGVRPNGMPGPGFGFRHDPDGPSGFDGLPSFPAPAA